MVLMMVRLLVRMYRRRWRMVGVLLQFDWCGRLGRIGAAERCAVPEVEWKANGIVVRQVEGLVVAGTYRKSKPAAGA